MKVTDTMPALNDKYLNKVQGQFENALRQLNINNNTIDIRGLIENTDPLWRSISANQSISTHLQEVDLFNYLIEHATTILSNCPSDDGTTTLGARAPDNAILTAGTAFIQFLRGIPYKHDAYFQLPFTLPSDISNVRITDNLFIKKIDDPTTLGFTTSSDIANALLGRTPHQYQPIKAGDTYLICKTEGYSRGLISGSATKHAYRLFKQFTYLGIVTGVFKYESWHNEQIFPNSFFIRHGLSEQPIRFDVPPATQTFLAKLKLAEDVFIPYFKRQSSATDNILKPALGYTTVLGSHPEEGTPEYTAACIGSFLEKLRSVPTFLATDCHEKKQIERAIEWGFEGLINHSQENGFIQTCIGLEAILGDKNLPRNSADRLADRCSYLLGNNMQQRIDLYDRFQALYKLRSNLIHGTADEISGNDLCNILDAENLLRRAIMKELAYFSR